MRIEDVRASLYECVLRKRILRPLMASAAPLFIICVVINVAVAAFAIDPLSMAAGLAVCFFALLVFAKGSYKALGWGLAIMALRHVSSFLGACIALFLYCFYMPSILLVLSQAICSAVFITLAVYSFKAAAHKGEAA